jgi:hypothetical protein
LIHGTAGRFGARCLTAASTDQSAIEYSGMSTRSCPMTAPTNQIATLSGRDRTSCVAA